MPDFDFSTVYGHQLTKEEAEAAEKRNAKFEIRAALADKIEHGDFRQVAAKLQELGPCLWEDVFPKSDQFVPSYTYENGKTSLTINQRIRAGGGGFFNDSVVQYVPRLTITSDSCAK
ncbi:MAG: hypothetical protein J0M35_17135 [Candidatus Obscuribacter phosphatis]|uniref:Uncharacterized protein n=1 Tax=Candidatus Obscuribacter phosphatis TaxID=1906157 RepID=A0A8J7TME9_9BACT|nr:hypothetical protein [Candidatus Obscuribacter phosphatis]